MIDLIHKIDALIEKIEGAGFWGYVQSVINKIKEVLKIEGEDEAIKFVEIMTE